jgi:signal transduction histidine kinase
MGDLPSRDFVYAFMETIREPFLVLDGNLHVQWANQLFYEAFDLSDKKTADHCIYDLGEGVWNNQDLRALIEKTIHEKNKCFGIRVKFQLSEDRQRVVVFNAFPVFREDGRLDMILLGMEDVTARENSEAELQRFRQELEIERLKLQSIIDSAPEGIVVADEECRIVLANPAARKLYGRTVPYGENFESHARLALCYTSGNPVGPRKLPLSRSVFDGETHQNVEMIVKWPDGNHRTLLVSTAPIKDSLGKTKGAVGIFQDITAIKNAQNERQKLLNQIEKYARDLQAANQQLKSQTMELRKGEENLRKEHEGLEKTVEYRTAELLALNEVLQEEIVERRETEKALRKSEEQLRILSQKLLESQEAERKVVAQELHDSVGASLAAIKYRLEGKLNEMGGQGRVPGRISLEQIISMVQETIKETKRISTNLRPSVLDDLGILPTIDWFCRDFEEVYTGIRIKKEIDLAESEVPESLKVPIYRILQEAMNNIAKHSEANHAHLYLGKRDEQIELRIEDNGIGFDLSMIHPMKPSLRRMGLTGMKERAELSGGQFKIRSEPEEGTVVESIWPVKVSMG